MAEEFQTPTGNKITEEDIRRIKMPYYNKLQATQLAAALVQIEGTNKSLVFSREEFGRSPSTLAQQIQQAWLYLIDHVDHEKYSALREEYEVEKRPHAAVIRKKRLMAPRVIEDSASDSAQALLEQWSEDFEKFINESKEGDHIIKDGFELKNDDEITIMKESIAALFGGGLYQFKVTPFTVKIARL